MEQLNWHKSSGIIKYDPPRPGMEKRTEWWAILKIDREILNPLGIGYDGSPKKYEFVNLCQPSWDAHISIIRGERPRNELQHLWKKYDGERVDFMYRHHPRQSGDTTGGDRPEHYWFVEVFCPRFDEIRNEFKLITGWKYHITVGRTYD